MSDHIRGKIKSMLNSTNIYYPQTVTRHINYKAID